jgi:hypothetical protein
MDKNIMKKRNIVDLSAKIAFLAQDPNIKDVRVKRCNTSNQLARCLQINPSTFRGYKHDNRISIEDEQKLAVFFGFDPHGWDEWQTGSVSSFKTRYCSEGMPPDTKNSEVKNTFIIPGPVRSQSAQPGRIASIEMYLRERGTEQCWDVRIALLCHSGPIEDMIIVVQRGFMDLELSSGCAPRDSWIGCPLPYIDESSQVMISAGAGTERRPTWSLEAQDLSIRYVVPSAPFCAAGGFSAGDSIKASFSIYVKDLKSKKGYIAEENGHTLGRRSREAILQRLALMSLPGAANGEAILSQCEMTFMGVQESSGTSSGTS